MKNEWKLLKQIIRRWNNKIPSRSDENVLFPTQFNGCHLVTPGVMTSIGTLLINYSDNILGLVWGALITEAHTILTWEGCHSVHLSLLEAWETVKMAAFIASKDDKPIVYHTFCFLVNAMMYAICHNTNCNVKRITMICTSLAAKLSTSFHAHWVFS